MGGRRRGAHRSPCGSGSEGSGHGVESGSQHGVPGRETPLSPGALLSNMRTLVTGAQDSVWSAQQVASTAQLLK